MTATEAQKSDLVGKLLVAVPQMADPRFFRSVILLCDHTTGGALGLVVNRPLTGWALEKLLNELSIPVADCAPDLLLCAGGPVGRNRGFVLHGNDYDKPESLVVTEQVSVTATSGILRDIARSAGPKNALVVLGYAGWGGGQLDSELKKNAWLVVESDSELLFQTPRDQVWIKALGKLGVDPRLFSPESGSA